MNNENTRTGNPAPLGMYRPALTFYHPNSKGSGAAVELKLHPAHDNVNGSIMLRIANQSAVGDRRTPAPTYARFDWENAICVKLDFNDLCKVLQVFRGECESIDGDRGLYHQTARAATKIQLRHLVEPVSGYSLEVYRNLREGGAGSHIETIGTIQVCHRSGGGVLDKNAHTRNRFSLCIRHLTGNGVLGEGLQSQCQDCKHHNNETFYHK